MQPCVVAGSAERGSCDCSRFPQELVPGWDKNLAIRIGIHSGPAIAAAMGKKSFKFTFIGDTVNVASRMESHGALLALFVFGDEGQRAGGPFWQLPAPLLVPSA